MQDESAGQRQFQKMTQAPVPRLIVTLAIPNGLGKPGLACSRRTQAREGG